MMDAFFDPAKAYIMDFAILAEMITKQFPETNLFCNLFVFC